MKSWETLGKYTKNVDFIVYLNAYFTQTMYGGISVLIISSMFLALIRLGFLKVEKNIYLKDFIQSRMMMMNDDDELFLRYGWSTKGV